MLRALIVDDESPARKRLKKLLLPLAEAGRLSVAGEASDGVEALASIKDQRFDVLFLDVQMPEMSGFDVLERIPEDQRPVVIFTTAYDEYAVKAFDANAIDYLLKPVEKKRLEQAIARAERLTGKPSERADDDNRFNVLLDWLDEHGDPGAGTRARPADQYIRQLSVPYRDRLIIVPVDRIIAAEVRDGITRLVILDERPGSGAKVSEYIVSYTLEQLEAKLDPDHFMRIHRSTIVQLDSIHEMISWFSGRFKLVLSGGHEVIASRERSKVLRQKVTI